MSPDKESPLLHWRAHHILLCGSSYVGKGYTDDYTARLSTMMQMVNQRPEGVRVKLVEGPDDWCKPLLASTDSASLAHQKHCIHPSTQHRDEMARQDLSQLLGRDIQTNSILTLTPVMVKLFRKAFRRATRAKQKGETQGYDTPRRGCHACSWNKMCDEIAQRHYRDIVLYPQATTQKIFPVPLVSLKL